MFRSRGSKRRGGNKVVRAVRTSIGWIIPQARKRDEQSEEKQKQQSREDFAKELNQKIKSARGLGRRISSVFRRRTSTIAPAEILKIQKRKENGARGHEQSIEDVLRAKQQQHHHRVPPPPPLGDTGSPGRRTSGLRLAGLGKEFVYRDFMPHYVERHDRYETFDSLLKRANKWIKDQQLQVLTLETLLVPAGNLPGRDSSSLDKFLSVEVLRIWYDKNQTLQQFLRSNKRELPKTLFSSHYFGKKVKSYFLC